MGEWVDEKELGVNGQILRLSSKKHTTYFSESFPYSTNFYPSNYKDLVTPQHLAKAAINCPAGQLLNQFQLEQRELKEYRYNYQCTDLNREVEAKTFANLWTLWGHTDPAVKEGSLNFLDRQIVNCTNRGYLKSVQLEVNPAKQSIRYCYECAKPLGQLFDQSSCSERRTEKAYASFWPTAEERQKYDSSNWSIISLDKHNVRCNDNEALHSFQMLTDVNLSFYVYTCCPLI